MAHFAKIENGTVVDLIVVNNEDCGNLEFPESEVLGQAFIESLAVRDPRLQGTWLQTSYNNNFRGVFGQIGFSYDDATDTFIPLPEEAPVTIEDLENIVNAGD